MVEVASAAEKLEKGPKRGVEQKERLERVLVLGLDVQYSTRGDAGPCRAANQADA